MHALTTAKHNPEKVVDGREFSRHFCLEDASMLVFAATVLGNRDWILANLASGRKSQKVHRKPATRR